MSVLFFFYCLDLPGLVSNHEDAKGSSGEETAYWVEEILADKHNDIIIIIKNAVFSFMFSLFRLLSLSVLPSSWLPFERSRSYAWECFVINLWVSTCLSVCSGGVLQWIITAICCPNTKHWVSYARAEMWQRQEMTFFTPRFSWDDGL